MSKYGDGFKQLCDHVIDMMAVTYVRCRGKDLVVGPVVMNGPLQDLVQEKGIECLSSEIIEFINGYFPEYEFNSLSEGNVLHINAEVKK